MSLVNQIVQRGAGVARGAAGQAGRLGNRVLSDAAGQVQRVRHMRPAPKDLDDATLARKVESIAFRDDAKLKSTVDVNVVEGRVELRGTAKNPAAITALVARVEAIPEVKGVENLLHPPKTKAPAPKKPKAGAQKKRKVTSKVTDDKTSRLAADAEPTGAELAQEKKGRQPAPLGNEGAESEGGGSQGKDKSGEGASGTPGERVERALEQGGTGDQSSSAAAKLAGGASQN